MESAMCVRLPASQIFWVDMTIVNLTTETNLVMQTNPSTQTNPATQTINIANTYVPVLCPTDRSSGWTCHTLSPAGARTFRTTRHHIRWSGGDLWLDAGSCSTPPTSPDAALPKRSWWTSAWRSLSERTLVSTLSCCCATDCRDCYLHPSAPSENVKDHQ